MITFENACDIAFKYFAQNDHIFGLSKALDTEKDWLFFGGSADETRFGGSGVLVSKEDGSTKDFILPSRENFAILKSGKPAELPERFRG
ncbi:MAG: hypothetical protein IJM55_05055 [Ruminococcus sp.]|nr:hypothetical protein [Ruminococcus sp.]